ncbi:helix-turn-helix transcriptional regulator [Olsenella sp. An293]|uniref:helix-turn-helix transcriptional regulator n=1 Tax=Olsenella sp. An293 TaxID=1965626 RepID=UPI001302CC8F|nr:helix-turn-helix transcriptional regulator [Olsenella sp. An293]
MAATTRCGDFFADRVTRLRFERERRGLTIAALARVAWMNSADVSKMERGRVLPSREQAQRIAAALRWEGPLEELFEPIGAGEASA